MSADLPPDWPFRPLSDDAVATAVLDMVVHPRHRVGGAVTVVLCDPDDRLVQPALTNEAAPGCATIDERADLLGPVVAALAQMCGGERFGDRQGGLLMALSRGDGLSITPGDLAWQRALHVLADGRCRVLGVHLFTRHGSRRLPPLARAA
ncbi:MAG TPA: hypothetical protein VFJ12_08970 [Segeticoccus sp.]|nr:hypothetical protein [Segeticoccus sp.]